MRGCFNDLPGPVQSAVLRALDDGLWRTPKEIAEKSGLPIGSVKGAISGMYRMKNRHWISRDREVVCHDSFGPKYGESRFKISNRGRKLKLHPLPEETGGWTDAELRRLVAALMRSRKAWWNIYGGSKIANEDERLWQEKDEAESELEKAVTGMTYHYARGERR